MVYNLEGMQAYTVIVHYLIEFWFATRRMSRSGRAPMDFWHGTLRAICDKSLPDTLRKGGCFGLWDRGGCGAAAVPT